MVKKWELFLTSFAIEIPLCLVEKNVLEKKISTSRILIKPKKVAKFIQKPVNK